MNLNDLIETAASSEPLSSADVESVARESGMPVPQLLDLFARTVATRYLREEYSYGFADMAMNQLMGFAHDATGPGLSDFAWQVYDAFDSGEYIGEGEAPEPPEQMTRELLGRIGSLG